MSVRVALIAVLLSLSTIGSTCINDNVHVSVNLSPIVSRFKLGTSTAFAAMTTVKLDSIISAEYKNKIKKGRVYDIRIKVEGQYTGSVSGAAAIQVGNGDPKAIIRFPQEGSIPWSTFYVSQSLLSNSPHLSIQSAGISELLNALTARPLPDVTLSALGFLSVAPVPDNLYVTVEVYLQADAEIN